MAFHLLHRTLIAETQWHGEKLVLTHRDPILRRRSRIPPSLVPYAYVSESAKLGTRSSKDTCIDACLS